jgi:alkylated DNA repair dioxygenase AlkB
MTFTALKGGSLRFAPADADVTYHPRVFGEQASAALFAALRTEVAWAERTVVIAGREVLQPRLVAWHGDPGAVYTYSGRRHDPEPWTEALLAVRVRVEALASVRFNSVLCNLYRDGRDSMGAHSDAERELGPEPVIASVSLGATRRFVLKRKRAKGTPPTSLDLEDGSVLVMRGPTQATWRHSIPKTSRPVGERINLTFRRILAT